MEIQKPSIIFTRHVGESAVTFRYCVVQFTLHDAVRLTIPRGVAAIAVRLWKHRDLRRTESEAKVFSQIYAI